MNNSYDEYLLELGTLYDVGLNDGTVLKKVRYIGTKQNLGKPMMCFKTENSKAVTVNPSYNSFCIEHEHTQKGEENG